MNVLVVVVVAGLLGAPALLGLLNGTVDPDQAAVRLLCAVLVALAVDWVVRGFVRLVAPAPTSGDPATDPADPAGGTADDGDDAAGAREERRRRRTDA